MTIKLQSIALGLILSVSPAFATIPDSLKSRIDSLMKVSVVSTGLQKYEADFKIAWDLFDVDNHVAAEHAGLAFEMAQPMGDTARIVKSGRLYGQLLRRVGQITEAVDIFQIVLPLAVESNNEYEIGKILNALAVASTNQAKFDLAVRYNLRLLDFRRARGDSAGFSETLNTLGVVYYKMENFEEACKYYLECVKIDKVPSQAFAFANLALCRLFLDDTLSFSELINRSLSARLPENSQETLLAVEYAKGFFFLRQTAPDSAQKWFLQSLKRARELDEKIVQIESMLGMSESKLLLGELRSSWNWLRQAEGALAGLDFDRLRLETYSLRAHLLKNKGDFRSALKYRERYGALRDSLLSQNVLNNVAVARVEFEAQENQKVIEQQAQLISLNDEVIHRQRWFNIVAVALAVLLVCFVVVLYRFVRFQKKISIELDRKVMERTYELQGSENALGRALGEQRAAMDFVSRQLRSSLATFRGLWSVGIPSGARQRDVSENFETAASELLKVASVVDRFAAKESNQLEGKVDANLESSILASLEYHGNGIGAKS